MAPAGGGFVTLELGIGGYELAPAECAELAGLLRSRGAESVTALVAARRLESLEAGVAADTPVDDAELDAIADAAWTWLEQVGTAGIPPRVLVLLDALRARHAHD